MEFKAPSGAKVVINAADFEDAINLKNAITRQLGLSGIKFDIDPSKTDIGSVIGAAMQVDSNPEVNAMLWPCLVRCTHNSQKITKRTFDDIAAREDYYEVVMACCKENLRPFFKSLLSQLKALPVVKSQAENGVQKSA